MRNASRYIVILSLCLIGFIGVLFSQDSADQPGGSFRLKVDVDLVTIEVYALDKNGNPVPNLKQEDFKLYEDGKRQDILSFDEVDAKAAASPSTMPLLDRGDRHGGKAVLILFDDSTIPQLHLQTARDSAAKFVREHMRSRDLFAVASWGTSMKILQNLTDDRDRVLAAIGQTATPQPPGTFYMEELLSSLEKINYSLAPLRGTKSILIYGKLRTHFGATLPDTYKKALNSARKSNVVYYTVDPDTTTAGSSGIIGPNPIPGVNRPLSAGQEGLPPTPMIGAVSGHGSGGLIPITLRSLASESGGLSIIDTNDIKGELDKLDQQLSHYYVLGFQSSNPQHDGAFHKVRIDTKRKGLTLKHRPGYQDRRPVDTLASSKQEQKLLTALASPSTATQLPLVFRAAYFYDSPQLARVVVAARIQANGLALSGKGRQAGADLNIMGAAYAESGSIAARFSETLPVGFEKGTSGESAKESITYRNYFMLRPGKYRLKLAASDRANNLGALEQYLELPAYPSQGPAFSSLVLAEHVSDLPALIRNLRTQLLDQSDPLLLSGSQIRPLVENRLPAGSSAFVLFRAYNLAAGPEQWNLSATPKLLDDSGAERFVLAPLSLKEVTFPADRGEAVIAFSVPFKNVPPGKYRLVIDVTETMTARTATVQTDLEFVR